MVMKKKTRKSTAGILALMSVSVLLLSILVYLWLRSQYKDEKQNLTKDLQYELSKAQQSAEESMMYEGFLKPLMKDLKISKANPAVHKNSISISMESNISLDSDRKTSKLKIKTQKPLAWNVSKADSIDHEELNKQLEVHTMDMRNDKKKEAIVRESMTIMINELMQLDSTNAQMDLLKLDTTKLHKQFTENLSLRNWHFNVKWYTNNDDTFSMPHGTIFIHSKHFRKYYHAGISGYNTTLMKKLLPQMLFSVLLLSTVAIAFSMTYRTMRQQMRLSDMKNDLISNMSHELKTPIATVQVALEALSNFNALEDPQRTKDYLHMATLEMNRLNLLVTQSLNNALLESGKIKLQKQTININDTIAEVIQMLSLKTAQHNARISFNTDGNSFISNVDKLHIQGVLINLIDNSIKYSKSNPVIDINLQEKPDGLMITVADNGIGIPKEYLDKVFDKFFRVPTGDTHDVKGYGLGLNYALQIIHQHDGTISVQNNPTGGTIFTIQLPKA
jgi:Osmosensitive K+ channel histidine kinase